MMLKARTDSEAEQARHDRHLHFCSVFRALDRDRGVAVGGKCSLDVNIPSSKLNTQCTPTNAALEKGGTFFPSVSPFNQQRSMFSFDTNSNSNMLLLCAAARDMEYFSDDVIVKPEKQADKENGTITEGGRVYYLWSDDVWYGATVLGQWHGKKNVKSKKRNSNKKSASYGARKPGWWRVRFDDGNILVLKMDSGNRGRQWSFHSSSGDKNLQHGARLSLKSSGKKRCRSASSRQSNPQTVQGNKRIKRQAQLKIAAFVAHLINKEGFPPYAVSLAKNHMSGADGHVRHVIDESQPPSADADPSMVQAAKARATTGYYGVYQNGSKWQAYIGSVGKFNYLGTFNTALQAAAAYDTAAAQRHGCRALLNF